MDRTPDYLHSLLLILKTVHRQPASEEQKTIEEMESKLGPLFEKWWKEYEQNAGDTE